MSLPAPARASARPPVAAKTALRADRSVAWDRVQRARGNLRKRVRRIGAAATEARRSLDMYNYQRWYRAEDGRYVSPDPIGRAGGEAGYSAYANSNPLTGSDPSGLRCGTRSCQDSVDEANASRPPPRRPSSTPRAQPCDGLPWAAYIACVINLVGERCADGRFHTVLLEPGPGTTCPNSDAVHACDVWARLNAGTDALVVGGYCASHALPVVVTTGQSPGSPTLTPDPFKTNSDAFSPGGGNMIVEEWKGCSRRSRIVHIRQNVIECHICGYSVMKLVSVRRLPRF